MNLRLIGHVVGLMLKIESLLLLVPLIFCVLDREPLDYYLAFIISAAIAYGLGALLTREEDVDYSKLYALESFAVVAATWILMSLIGSLPYLLSGTTSNFFDAFFESTSGFTGTAASVVEDILLLPQSILFWRSFTQWIGGAGILIFVSAVLPKATSQSSHILRAESNGPSYGRLKRRATDSAKNLVYFYIAMTILVTIILSLVGLPVFDAMLITFGTVATSGFNPYPTFDGIYDVNIVRLVLMVTMLIFSLNVNIFIHAMNREWEEIKKSEELRWYFGILIFAAFFIIIDLLYNGYSLSYSLKEGVFTVGSVSSTTAYATEDFDTWPTFSRLILLYLMMVGGMSGSTAGGLKVSRVAFLSKIAYAEVQQMTYPNRIVTVNFEGTAQPKRAQTSVVNYFVIYVAILIFAILIVSLEAPDFSSALSGASAMLNNIGTGFGTVGPSGTYDYFSNPMKFFLTFVMIVGRLEIFPVLVLLSPNLWRKRLY